MKRAIVFPGLGYGADRPLLYYAGKLAVAAGYGLVKVSYGELPHVERPSAGKGLDVEALEECFRLALERASAQLEAEAIGRESPSDILIISKSIGTVVGAAWAASKGMTVRQVLYTPVARTFDFPHADCIAFHGMADPWLGNDEFLELCRRTSVPLHVFDGANHSLECGDVARDIGYLGVVMQMTEEFIRADGTEGCGTEADGPGRGAGSTEGNSAADKADGPEGGGSRASLPKAPSPKSPLEKLPRLQFGRNWRVLQGREDEEMLREKSSGWSSRNDRRGDYDGSEYERD